MKKFFSKTIDLIFLAFALSFPLLMFSQDIDFTPADYKERREALEALIADGVAILANAQSRDVLYYTGVDIPDAKLIFIPKNVAQKAPRPDFWKTTLLLPSKDPRRGVWDDYELFPGEEAIKVTGIENTADLNEFNSLVSRLGTLTDSLYVSFGTRSNGPSPLPDDLQFIEGIKHLLPNVKIKNLSPLIDELRWKKSTKEIAIMKKACQITSEAFLEAARITRPGVYEYQIESFINYLFRKNGSQQAAFLIIGSGPNSCILHHMNNDRLMEAGNLLVIDIGTVYKHMSTDLTRTIPVSGKFTEEQKKVYSIVLEAQKKAISIVKPGITLAEIHKAAKDVIEAAGYGKYFMHGTTHTLNGGSALKPGTLGTSLSGTYGQYKMDNYFAANNPVVPGTMLTIEPGIYIAEKCLGIRIEDDILVTDDGYEILTKDAPREIEEIERLMKEKAHSSAAERR